MSLHEFCVWYKSHGDNESIRVFCNELLNKSDFNWKKDIVNQCSHFNPVIFCIFWETYSQSAFSTTNGTK